MLQSSMDAPSHDEFVRLEQLLNYAFRDRALLERALRHTSWCNEQGPRASRPEDNERLEFLGDAVLDLVVGHALMEAFPVLREGELSVTRAQVVSEAGLSEVAQALGLGAYLRLGNGEERSGGRQKPSILANALEAIVAAVYLDAGYEAAARFAKGLLGDRIQRVEVRGFADFKTRLQEAAQGRGMAAPQYRVVHASGPDHQKAFVVAVDIDGQEYARATGKSKKEAEQQAAAAAHFKLESLALGLLTRDDG